MSKSKLPFSYFSHLILSKNPKSLKPISHYRNFHHFNRAKPLLEPNSAIPTPKFTLNATRHLSSSIKEKDERLLREWLIMIEKEKQNDREAKRKSGIPVNEGDDDVLGATPLIKKIERQLAEEHVTHNKSKKDPVEEEDMGFDSDEERSDDPHVIARRRRLRLVAERKLDRYKELLQQLIRSRTCDDSIKWLKKLDKFEEKHAPLRLEFRVIDELINRFKDATGKDKFMLAHKLNRAMKMVEWKESFDPRDPANYGIFQRASVSTPEGVPEGEDEDEDDDKENPMVEGKVDDDEEEEFDDMKERDDILLEKLNAIDKKLEEKLTALDYTFGKKGKLLEEEIRDLAEKRNSMTEKKQAPMYRKGFDVKTIDLNKTCKVTKGGRVFKYTAIVACGNYKGVVGYAKAKGPTIPAAVQKAREKCFQNLHYIDRYEDHTIAHAIQTSCKRTKLYLWPAKADSGMRTGKTVHTILNLAGFHNVKSKIIGSRNPHNVVKAVFQALNAIETPKDVQEKFGRTVVETYLL